MEDVILVDIVLRIEATFSDIKVDMLGPSSSELYMCSKTEIYSSETLLDFFSI